MKTKRKITYDTTLYTIYEIKCIFYNCHTRHILAIVYRIRNMYTLPWVFLLIHVDDIVKIQIPKPNHHIMIASITSRSAHTYKTEHWPDCTQFTDERKGLFCEYLGEVNSGTSSWRCQYWNSISTASCLNRQNMNGVALCIAREYTNITYMSNCQLSQRNDLSEQMPRAIEQIII